MFFSNCVWYWIGRLFEERIRRTDLFKKRFPQIEKYIDKTGVFQLFLCRFVYGTRNATMLIWGIRKYNFSRFVMVDFLSCLMWGGLLLSLGYFLSFTVKSVIGDIKDAEVLLLIFLIVVIAFFAINKFFSKPKRTQAK